MCIDVEDTVINKEELWSH